MPRVWLLAYDVSAGASRRRVAQQLLDVGLRRQRSVFAVPAAGRDVRRLVERLADHLAAGDHLLALPLCARCQVYERGTALEPYGFAGSAPTLLAGGGPSW